MSKSCHKENVTLTLKMVVGSSLRLTRVITLPESSSTSKILAGYGNCTSSTRYLTRLAGKPCNEIIDLPGWRLKNTSRDKPTFTINDLVKKKCLGSTHCVKMCQGISFCERLNPYQWSVLQLGFGEMILMREKLAYCHSHLSFHSTSCLPPEIPILCDYFYFLPQLFHL